MSRAGGHTCESRFPPEAAVATCKRLILFEYTIASFFQDAALGTFANDVGMPGGLGVCAIISGNWWARQNPRLPQKS